MQHTAFQGGFTDAPIQAAHAFRACLNAMARPGELQQIAGAAPPAPLSVAAGTVLLTLCDPETPVYLAGAHSAKPIQDWVTFHTAAPLVGPSEAHFALGIWDALPPLTEYRIGTPEYPDRSATLIVECTDLDEATHMLAGPGIKATRAAFLPEAAAFTANHALFPLGLDFYFTAGDQLTGLPRTTRLEAL
ncbi:phosphonate C-P lyase system protein PhnH [Actibacterium sp. 188UL27-1]|uniref:phosphonate C-P lyase system protein PhnH n=1 Tax=Actibacterium sp. 188UL27-1 TaxID=2786961 RepID=UPI00195B63C8|nr:phosphonate C-P lyase system protein PhnH [Actibacterium sp. 188UL27-1]MBM7067972.1 phosphonate C-P lyase system protein PhnH [Actibacterium sp. 188UL27-1]